MSLRPAELSALIAGGGYGSGDPVIAGVSRDGRVPVFAGDGRLRG